MTERKPPGMPFESWIDKQVREAAERGEFDNLKGAGQPIPPGATDENSWLRSYLKREGATADALLPEAIILRRERERIHDTVRDLHSEREVRALVTALNERIVDYLRMPTGPHVSLGPVKTDEVVATWRTHREKARAARTPAAAPHRPRVERPWWRRLFG
ncbi:DUF1992 domain-containing protein [Nocardia yunnanensis]|uniref:DUF1992 domain-containing protein n=1 Tax=Nocardia yunnanensis TaxID=2382165 RepID=A0A386ZME4_9NOCA|nr:DUF1992 domain-containing protein [Nocardia yunnanensis]AYF78493.1 DUF1992 domain-containing protein [Nocardia yunnanensis]